jgi:hypothetical protein
MKNSFFQWNQLVFQVIWVTFFATSTYSQAAPIIACGPALANEVHGIPQNSWKDLGATVRVVDPDNAKFFAQAQLMGDFPGGPALVFDFKLREVDSTGVEIGRSKKLAGKTVFSAMVNHFDAVSKVLYGQELSRIYARWDRSSDNTKLMNQVHLAQPHLTLEEIAKKTWTGQQAIRFHFSEIDVEVARTEDNGKAYYRFRVSFWRPNYFTRKP